MPGPSDARFAVFGEATGHDKPLFMHDLTFAQVIDEIVVPLESGKPFFVDGAPLTKKEIRRLKVVEQTDNFPRAFADLHHQLSFGSNETRKVTGDQYHVRLEAVVRQAGRDVTAQVMQAFDTEVKPRLRDYLPKRQELIAAALQVFVEGMKLHAGSP